MSECTKLVMDKPFPVDCDETLVMADLSDYDEKDYIEIPFSERAGPIKVVVNQKNVNTVMKLAKLDYDIIIWSKTGAEWARRVAEITGLDTVAVAYAAKPNFYMDDLEADKWMGSRVWRDPKEGKEG